MLPSMFDETEIKCGFLSLPPSVRIVQDASNKSLITSLGSHHGVCDVAYYLEARLFFKGQVVGKTIREIIVMPVSEKPPPVDPGDLANEYRLFASSPLSTSWRRKQAMTVSISSSEPRAVLFETPRVKDSGGTGDCTPSTEIILSFSARQMLSGEHSEDVQRPEISECDITLTLEATTYFLRNEEHSVLSVAEARGVPFSVVKTTRFKSQKMKFHFLNWERTLTCKSQEQSYT